MEPKLKTSPTINLAPIGASVNTAAAADLSQPSGGSDALGIAPTPVRYGAGSNGSSDNQISGEVRPQVASNIGPPPKPKLRYLFLGLIIVLAAGGGFLMTKNYLARNLRSFAGQEELRQYLTELGIVNSQGELDLAKLRGPQGSSGDKGDKGDPGSPGYTTVVSGPQGLTGATGSQGLQGENGCISGECVSLQGSSPGTQEVGHLNISGSGLFGGNVGIGTASPAYLLHAQKDQNTQTGIMVKNGTAGTAAASLFYALNNIDQGIFIQAFSPTYTTSGLFAANYGMLGADSGLDGLVLRTGLGDPILFGAGNVERMRIDGATGNVGIGTASPSEILEVQSNTSATRGTILGYYANDNSGSLFKLQKSRSATKGAHVILQNGDIVGQQEFHGSDGVQFQQAAMIRAQIDGVTGLNDMPGRLLFYTTPDGSNVSLERVRIDNTGNVGIGTTSPGQKLEVNGGIRLATVTAKPACGSTTRGTIWFTQAGAGVKDSLEVCAKDAADAYAWRTIY